MKKRLIKIFNKETFGNYLLISVFFMIIAFVCGYIINFLQNYLLIELGLTSFQIFFITAISTLILSIISIAGLVLLIVHGFKNDDTYLIIAGFLDISQIGYIIMIALLFPLFMNPP